ncbi:class II aldolase/adducin family protein [Burkholderia stabilis]|uniref:Class II aldolase/adducin family protein n=1 Tax=Burkholderia stabilis TaxID=95485 RepID=A0A4V1PQK6_9BURK|nr:class II aldolase/adducin family protein [Burkholderia stabilis]RXV64424.1 class II aldolase/adducin family protein [Burkholderia stabilis]
MTSSIRDQVSADEWQARIDLAACYRLVARYGWGDLVFTHISARVPGSEHHFLTNPYGMLFDEITASSLIKVDHDCNKLSDGPHPINPAGFNIRDCIHAARPDVGWVLHTHTRAKAAVSAQKQGVLPISQQSTFVLSSITYQDYEGVAIRADEGPCLQADLGDATFFMLRNHGLLTVGPTVADAFLAMYAFETTCQIPVAALSSGSELLSVDQRIFDDVRCAMKVQGLSGAFAWPALLRNLDRIDPGYRQ